ncbi:MAG: hypothetical protein ABR924_17535 [Terracidiphilus sp.]|jgi:hypothetical protein
MTKDIDPKGPAKYEAVLRFTQYSRAVVPLHADSLAEAQKLADEIHADDVEDWNFLYDDVSVEEVQEAGEGVEDE